LISKRREHALTSCPYCGNPTIPDTLDHFIPKDKLAEYSIYPNNLVPQCRSCAPIKSNKYFSQENDLVMFAHPFYSTLLDNVIIEIISSLDEGKVNFQVKFSTRTDDVQEQRAIILHIISLKVKERILVYCDKEIKNRIRKLKTQTSILSKFFMHDILSMICMRHEVIGSLYFIVHFWKNDSVMQYLKSISPDEQQNQSDDRELITLNI
jgi:hypothetical protein